MNVGVGEGVGISMAKVGQPARAGAGWFVGLSFKLLEMLQQSRLTINVSCSVDSLACTGIVWLYIPVDSAGRLTEIFKAHSRHVCLHFSCLLLQSRSLTDACCIAEWLHTRTFNHQARSQQGNAKCHMCSTPLTCTSPNYLQLHKLNRQLCNSAICCLINHHYVSGAPLKPHSTTSNASGPTAKWSSSAISLSENVVLVATRAIAARISGARYRLFRSAAMSARGLLASSAGSSSDVSFAEPEGIHQGSVRLGSMNTTGMHLQPLWMPCRRGTTSKFHPR